MTGTPLAVRVPRTRVRRAILILVIILPIRGIFRMKLSFFLLKRNFVMKKSPRREISEIDKISPKEWESLRMRLVAQGRG